MATAVPSQTVEKPRVVAVVVTFRRAPVLERCLAALAAQTNPPEAIVVVDNGSTRDAPDVETTAVLESFDEQATAPTLYVVRPYANIGPGGGFARGIQRALELGAVWLWIMDDDIESEPGCLSALKAIMKEKESGGDAQKKIYWPMVLNPDDSSSVEPGWWGFLLAASAVKEHGLPREDFVWWSEDTEFLQWRLARRTGFEHVRTSDAVVHHLHASRGGATPSWKLYYVGRNATYVRLYLKRYNYWRLFRLTASLLNRALHPPAGERRIHRLRLAVRGVVDGLSGRLGRRIEPGTGKPLPRSAW